MQEFAIIVAGGSGSRMKSELPKQFLPIGGLPVLMHTLRTFRAYSPTLSIRLVLPSVQFDLWHSLCETFHFDETYELIAGGETRFHSVQNGLASIQAPTGVVAVHDGVRPFVTPQIIANSFQQAAALGTAVTCVTLKDSIRQILPNEKNQAVERTAYRLIQTPQTFRLNWMREAFQTGFLPHFTDCASVLETAGFSIQLIEGAYENIKITTPEDLIWAEAFLKK
ncbi:2-C-methyl-D-erythritol 4-phosphate cytidylyltransferase [Arundinibacter roseus]|uniref:2-C-methyl-D-erythritol 4-phosphate cytidylyltransferase n=1 Tax=Arundinibacter roseus TaxID=2070510 RepID=A0A4R4KGP7_9BACT|nr:2-C-methyl-D-erythritol 4-phosphate cytidylyltransferase [Arundinibacter roseus]TDB66086.1 2-C-methyl-D-erythritol 4-phosphate cytidylyltransferase [Arundinibacter roseus]